MVAGSALHSSSSIRKNFRTGSIPSDAELDFKA
jgi:hypothetical protein